MHGEKQLHPLSLLCELSLSEAREQEEAPRERRDNRDVLPLEAGSQPHTCSAASNKCSLAFILSNDGSSGGSDTEKASDQLAERQDVCGANNADQRTPLATAAPVIPLGWSAAPEDASDASSASSSSLSTRKQKRKSSKYCIVEGCESRAKHARRCWKHGGSVKCKVPDCVNRAKSKGVCWSHGGGTMCSHPHCDTIAVSNGFCWAHGGGKRCVIEGCSKPAYERTENLCNLHYKVYLRPTGSSASSET